jgi:hypothetical protein
VQIKLSPIQPFWVGKCQNVAYCFVNIHIFSIKKTFIYFFLSIEPNSYFMSEIGVKPTGIVFLQD